MRVLLVNLSRMGDLVQMTPAAKGLKEQLGAEVSVLVYANLAEFARGLAGVDHVLTLDEEPLVESFRDHDATLTQQYQALAGQVETLRRTEYDLICNLTHTLFSAILTYQLRGERKLGRIASRRDGQNVRGAWMRYFYAAVTSRRLNAFNLADIHRRSCGVTQPAGPMEYHLDRVAPEARESARELLKHLPRPRIVVSPGASVRQRRWPAEHFSQLINALSRNGILPILLGSSSEEELCMQVAEGAEDQVLNLAGKTDLFTFAGVLAEADLAITNDSGPSHVAAALGTPVVSISLAMVRPEGTAPLRPGNYVLETLHPNHPCPEANPCPVCTCGELIPVDAVYETAMAVLEKRPPRLEALQNAGGRYRLRITDIDPNGDQVVRTLYSGKAEPHQQFDMDAVRTFWRGVLDDNDEAFRTMIPLAGLPPAERLFLLKTALLLDEITRLFESADDEPVAELLAQVEKLLQEIEEQAQWVRGMLLTCRLERETLYAGGRDALRGKGTERLRRWAHALRVLAGDKAAEAAA